MIEFTPFIILLIIVVGFIAGFVNTLAGTGSLLTIPFLMFLGLPANVANATNRIMVLFSSFTGVASFKQQNVFSLKEGVWLSIPAVLGSILGAIVATSLNEDLMEKIIGGLMIMLLFMLIYKPERWIKPQSTEIITKFGPWQYVVMFLVGFYGGFIQIGVGVFILASLVLSAGLDLIKANAIKLFITLVYTVFVIAVFAYAHQINYKVGFVLAGGSMAGAFIASRMAVKRGVDFIRWILIGVVLIASIKFLGVYDWVITFFN